MKASSAADMKVVILKTTSFENVRCTPALVSVHHKQRGVSFAASLKDWDGMHWQNKAYEGFICDYFGAHTCKQSWNEEDVVLEIARRKNKKHSKSKPSPIKPISLNSAWVKLEQEHQLPVLRRLYDLCQRRLGSRKLGVTVLAEGGGKCLQVSRAHNKMVAKLSLFVTVKFRKLQEAFRDRWCQNNAAWTIQRRWRQVMKHPACFTMRPEIPSFPLLSSTALCAMYSPPTHAWAA